MKIEEIIGRFHAENTIDADSVSAIQNNTALRKDLISYSRRKHDRPFALALLNKFVSIRGSSERTMPAEALMLACYNLGLHNQIEDSLKIWEAKKIDFDTFCMVDIQLMAFAGVKKTIGFLKEEAGNEAGEALVYFTECATSGDFDDLDSYFSPETSQWFI